MVTRPRAAGRPRPLRRPRLKVQHTIRLRPPRHPRQCAADHPCTAGDEDLRPPQPGRFAPAHTMSRIGHGAQPAAALGGADRTPATHQRRGVQPLDDAQPGGASRRAVLRWRCSARSERRRRAVARCRRGRSRTGRWIRRGTGRPPVDADFPSAAVVVTIAPAAPRTPRTPPAAPSQSTVTRARAARRTTRASCAASSGPALRASPPRSRTVPRAPPGR